MGLQIRVPRFDSGRGLHYLSEKPRLFYPRRSAEAEESALAGLRLGIPSSTVVPRAPLQLGELWHGILMTNALNIAALLWSARGRSPLCEGVAPARRGLGAGTRLRHLDAGALSENQDARHVFDAGEGRTAHRTEKARSGRHWASVRAAHGFLDGNAAGAPWHRAHGQTDEKLRNFCRDSFLGIDFIKSKKSRAPWGKRGALKCPGPRIQGCARPRCGNREEECRLSFRATRKDHQGTEFSRDFNASDAVRSRPDEGVHHANARASQADRGNSPEAPTQLILQQKPRPRERRGSSGLLFMADERTTSPSRREPDLFHPTPAKPTFFVLATRKHCR